MNKPKPITRRLGVGVISGLQIGIGGGVEFGGESTSTESLEIYGVVYCIYAPETVFIKRQRNVKLTCSVDCSITIYPA